jgi:hypothetical protein
MSKKNYKVTHFKKRKIDKYNFRKKQKKKRKGGKVL